MKNLILILTAIFFVSCAKNGENLDLNSGKNLQIYKNDLCEQRQNLKDLIITTENSQNSFCGVFIGENKFKVAKILQDKFENSHISAYKGGIGIYLDNEFKGYFALVYFDLDDKVSLISYRKNEILELH